MKQAVTFYSEGCKIAADLYLPEAGPAAPPVSAPAPAPGVVLAHGFAGIKEVMLPPYGERLAQAGFVALAFDYRCFGESESFNDRGRLIPFEQMTDIRSAITYLQTLPAVDPQRIGLWGTSFGGANVLRVAAADKRVKAVVAQITFASGRRMVLGGKSPEEVETLLDTLRKAQEREVTKNRPLKLRPDQLITDEDSKVVFPQMAEQFPQLADLRMPVTILAQIIEHNPEDDFDRITCPVLVLGASDDVVIPVSEARAIFDGLSCDKKLVILDHCRHYSAYSGKPFDQGIAEILAWYEAHLR